MYRMWEDHACTYSMLVRCMIDAWVWHLIIAYIFCVHSQFVSWSEGWRQRSRVVRKASGIWGDTVRDPTWHISVQVAHIAWLPGRLRTGAVVGESWLWYMYSSDVSCNKYHTSSFKCRSVFIVFSSAAFIPGAAFVWGRCLSLWACDFNIFTTVIHEPCM